MPEVVIPYRPRPLQKQLHEAVTNRRWAAIVCHRRFGKTVWAINHLQKATLLCPRDRPRFYYIAPTFRMGKAISWDYMQHFAAPIPGVGINQAELRIDYPNGGRLQILGADSPDSMRGLYIDGAVFDEYGMMPPNVFTEVLRPAFADREGWAVFMGTPAGKNQFYDSAQQAQRDPSWHYAEHKASETGIIAPGELSAAKQVMTPDEYAQEFECSFEASVKGAIYATELSAARLDGRITTVPYEPKLPVDTAWDLGVGDNTAIWFSQSLRSGEVRLIDYYESSGEGLPHYVSVLQSKPYTYGTHWAPHDIQVREFSSGQSRQATAASLGVKFSIAPNVALEDGIHAVRLLLPRCWFDQTKCQAGIEALQHYRRDYNTRLNEFKATPVHDWASHCADAFRMLAVRSHELRKTREAARLPAMTGPTAWMGG